MKMQIEAVLFDLGSTLVRTVEPPEIYKRILGIYGVEVSFGEVLKAHRANENEFDFEEMAKSGRDFWIGWNLKILEAVGIREDREFLADKIDELWWENAGLEIYPDVTETLAQLKEKGVKVGVVTNALERDFEEILEKLRLTNCFDVVVGIDTCGGAKPNKKIFLYALDRLRVPAAKTLFIGDSIKYDYEGARGAGLKPLIIDRQGEAPANVDTIRSLTDVLSLI